MSRVLLISVNRCTTPDPVFPLGLAHLSAALRHAGHTTRWLDLLASDLALEQVLNEFKPDLVGLSLRNIDDVLIRKKETFFDSLPELCARIRTAAGCPVVVGGSGFSIFPKELLTFSGADYGICGPGETALPELVAALAQGNDPRRIPGLVYAQGGEVRVNAPAAAPTCQIEAEDLPAEVTRHYLRNGGMLNLQTQRGCAFHCCYCTYPVIEGRAHRRRPPEEIAAEMEQAARLGARFVFMVDSVFNSSARHVQEVCEAILRRPQRPAWGCFLRPQGLTPELMKLMARAGLTHIEFGSDSFSDAVLAAYHKGLTFDDIFHSNECARRENIDCCHFLICGGPGETRETLREGFERSRRLAGAVLMAVVGMRIYPGTQLYERAVAENQIAPQANLLNPVYYLTPALKAEEIFEELRQMAAGAPNWIFGEPSPAYARLVERLRQRGVTGPLWGYLSMIQRLWPQGLAEPQPAS